MNSYFLFFIEHLRTAASETVTENSLGNSTWCEKCSDRDKKLMICPLDVGLGSKFTRATQPSILKNKIQKSISQCLMTGLQSLTKKNR